MLENEPALRLAASAGLFCLFAILEALLPRRTRTTSRLSRWRGNLFLVVVNTLLARAVFIVLATSTVAFALYVEHQGWGLLNLVAWPGWLEILVAVLLLDIFIYGQHVVMHHVPMLWALHKVHHADTEIDVTTGVRFHPLEILFSLALKFAAIAAFGASALAVLLFEVILNATSMFNHSNLKLPLGFDRLLRLILVTPDMHRVHHSVVRAETDSNFGFNVTWWDRLFRTYRDQPEAGHDAMHIGLPVLRDDGERRLDKLLTMPFRPERQTSP